MQFFVECMKIWKLLGYYAVMLNSQILEQIFKITWLIDQVLWMLTLFYLGGGEGGFKLSSGDFFQSNSRKIIWTFGVSRKSLIWHVSQIWSRSLVPIPKYSSNHWVNWLDLCSSLLYLKLFITANGNVPIDKQLRS